MPLFKKHVMLYSDLVGKLLKSTYVDDIVKGAGSKEAAYRLYNNSKELLNSTGGSLHFMLLIQYRHVHVCLIT